MNRLRPLNRRTVSALLITCAVVTCGTAHATNYTTVDLSSYVNSNVAINAATYPTGLSTGNRGLAIPFQIATYPVGNNVEGTWNPDYANGNTGVGSQIAGISLTVNLASYDISGQSSFYALLNNYFGTPGADEYDVTIKASNGDSVTYQSIGGVDTRDYNTNVFTNTIANTTTEWFDNGIGQRFDVREFNLPTSFANETISSFTITQVTQGNYGDAALFSGLTFSTAPAVAFVPEPGSAALLGLGVLALMLRRRRD